MRKPKPIAENFFRRINKDGPNPDPEKYPELDKCWIWTGFLWRGYGRLRVSRSKMMRSHRVSWMIHHGEIPDGLHVLHKCDNPSCVNPSHLFLGDHEINMKDCAKKGRTVSGRAKINEMQARVIRRLAEYGTPSSYMSSIFGITRANVNKAIRRETWAKA